jgi:hypothetical protein
VDRSVFRAGRPDPGDVFLGVDAYLLALLVDANRALVRTSHRIAADPADMRITRQTDQPFRSNPITSQEVLKAAV